MSSLEFTRNGIAILITAVVILGFLSYISLTHEHNIWHIKPVYNMQKEPEVYIINNDSQFIKVTVSELDGTLEGTYFVRKTSNNESWLNKDTTFAYELVLDDSLRSIKIDSHKLIKFMFHDNHDGRHTKKEKWSDQ